MVLRRPFHPVLFAVHPILFLLARNIWAVPLREALVPLAASVLGVAVIQGIGTRLLPSADRVAVVSTALIVVFFNYGRVSQALIGEQASVWDFVLPAVAVLLLGAVGVLVLRGRSPLPDLTRLLNVIGLGLVALVTGSMVFAVVDDRASGQTSASTERAVAAERPGDGRRPDIYYLVFDRYGDGEALREHFGFDNGPFLDGLRKRGFVIADRSRTNYQNTHYSLAASLNMRYLDSMAGRLRRPTSDPTPVFRAIDDHAVGRRLKAAGYRYVHVGSTFGPTKQSSIADVNIRLDPSSEFTRTFYASTALLPLMRRGIVGRTELDPNVVHATVALRELRAIERTTASRGPKFVFAHILLPHPPYVFERDGSRVRTPPDGQRERAHAYIEQLRYTNTRIEQLVDALLSGPAASRPVVVIQGDEGPYPRTTTFVPGRWWRESDSDLRVKFGILNAFYLPGVDADAIHPSISPVNSFRVILNAYLGEDLPMLPDESYAWESNDDRYHFRRITDRVQRPPEPAFPDG
jgi:hypothetical protein